MRHKNGQNNDSQTTKLQEENEWLWERFRFLTKYLEELNARMANELRCKKIKSKIIKNSHVLKISSDILPLETYLN